MSDRDRIVQPTWFSSSRYRLDPKPYAFYRVMKFSPLVLFMLIFLYIRNIELVFLISTIVVFSSLFARIYFAYSGELIREVPNPAYRFSRLLLGLVSICFGLMVAVSAWHDIATGRGVSLGEQAIAIFFLGTASLWWITKPQAQKGTASDRPT